MNQNPVVFCTRLNTHVGSYLANPLRPMFFTTLKPSCDSFKVMVCLLMLTVMQIPCDKDKMFKTKGLLALVDSFKTIVLQHQTF